MGLEFVTCTNNGSLPFNHSFWSRSYPMQVESIDKLIVVKIVFGKSLEHLWNLKHPENYVQCFKEVFLLKFTKFVNVNGSKTKITPILLLIIGAILFLSERLNIILSIVSFVDGGLKNI